MNLLRNIKKMGILLSLASLLVSNFSFYGAYDAIIATEDSAVRTAHNTQDLAIAFDAHDVLFDFDYKSLVCKVCEYGLLFGGAIGSVGLLLGRKAMIKAALLVAALPVIVVGDFVTRILSFKKQHGHRPVVEQVWDADPLLRFLKPEYVQLESLFKPNEEMFALIDQLKKQGYKVGIASNIAPETLQLLQKRYPDHFNKFDFITSPCQENGWVDKKKPQQFFGELQHKASGKLCILIDDKQENCRNAEQENMLAVCFKGNMEELRAALQDKGVKI